MDIKPKIDLTATTIYFDGKPVIEAWQALWEVQEYQMPQTIEFRGEKTLVYKLQGWADNSDTPTKEECERVMAYLGYSS